MLPFHLQYILYGNSSGLFVRPVYTKKVNMFNFKIKDFKLLNTAGWSRTKVRIENDTKLTEYMNMEQEPFMKDFFDSYGILPILGSDYWEETIMSTLLISNDEDEENALVNIKQVHFTMCATDLVQPPQCLQVAIVDNALESVIKIGQCYKIFHSESSHNLSRYKCKWNYLQSTFWLHPVPINVNFTLLPILQIQKGNFIPHIDIFLKAHSILSVASNIDNQNLIIKGKDSCSPSTATVFKLSDHEYLSLGIVPMQEYFVEVFVKNQTYVLLKGCTVRKQYLYRYYHNKCNVSIVSIIVIYLRS